MTPRVPTGRRKGKRLGTWHVRIGGKGIFDDVEEAIVVWIGCVSGNSRVGSGVEVNLTPVVDGSKQSHSANCGGEEGITGRIRGNQTVEVGHLRSGRRIGKAGLRVIKWIGGQTRDYK